MNQKCCICGETIRTGGRSITTLNENGIPVSRPGCFTCWQAWSVAANNLHWDATAGADGAQVGRNDESHAWRQMTLFGALEATP